MLKNNLWIENDRIYMESKNTQKKDYKVKLLERWYRQQAKRIFPTLTAKVFKMFNFTGELPKVRVIKMKRRYGTCYYHRNQINLNLKLIKADPAAIEFVIAHELTHFIHHNHSKQFYDALTNVMPDWKQREQRLKELKILNYYNL
jgi:hypothetical protein